MTNRNTETPQGEGNAAPPPPPPGGPDPPESQASRGGNTIFKSGPLFISSKGIGWTSWKKRWFILTRTSLVFFRSDPSAVQKGSEVNLTLGGIDLNNSGSVVVKADKKLLTVLFPDGRDGRAFTLKAETLEDLHEWKTALENALSQAPNGGAHAVGQNGILGNEKTDPVDGSADQSKDKKPVKSTVIGVPVLLALEDVDGAPSFLEKALRFVEDHGVKVEGILRQAADVEDVESRVREYEQGKLEFTPEEDAHVIADCVKYVLRELPSPPVPASCCNALLDSFRKSGNDRNGRINAMRTTICDTFPEPNRRLLQRILLMMQSVAENKAVNRMSCSAVAACMAPLLLRPLLAGDCEIDNDFDVGGDGSVQLLQAAAAANHAQAIVITLLEEYDNIFGEGDMSPELYSDTEDDESETEGATDEDDDYYEDDETDIETDGEVDIVSDGTCSESGGSGHNDLHNNKDVDGVRSGSHSPHGDDDSKAQKLSSSSVKIMHPDEEHDVKISVTEKDPNSSKTILAEPANEVVLVEDISTETSSTHQPTGHGLPTVQKSSTIANGPAENARHHRTAWGRTAARKNLSMESIDFGLEEEAEIEKLEITKSDLENRIAEEVQGNAVLQASLDRQKTALRERRLALEQDVARLQEQLQNEKDLTAALEAGLNMSSGGVPNLANVDEKTRVDIEEIAQGEASVANLTKKVDDLGVQINQQRERNQGAMPDASTLSQYGHDQHEKSQTMNTSEAKQKDSEHEAIDLPEGEDYCLLDHRGGSDWSRSKDTNQDGTEDANEKKRDAAQKSNSRSVGAPAEVCAVQPVSSKPAPTNSKKSGSGGSSPDVSPVEPVGSKPNSTRSNKSGSGGGSSPEVSPVEPGGSKPSSSNSKKSGSGSETTSAITKLTSRLNFLKERRSQIANEISGRSSSGQPLPAQNLDKSQPLQNSDKNSENSEKPEKLRKAESHTERVKKSESQLQQQLDRGKSESHLSVTVEKGRVVESSKRSPGSR